jgi:hypothetical protein
LEPTEVDGRLYGRGVADDKAGVTAHLAALRAHAGKLPVGVTVFVEGEEEVGSDSLPAILARHGHRLAADAIILADSGNWDIGLPASRRRCAACFRAVVTVTTLDHGDPLGHVRGGLPGRPHGPHPAPGHPARRGRQRRGRGAAEGQAAALDYDEAGCGVSRACWTVSS